MTSTALTHLSISYVECDIPGDQTLVEWRRELDAARRAQRRAPRNFRFFPRLPFVWSAS
jgi:hypothetical protein